MKYSFPSNTLREGLGLNTWYRWLVASSTGQPVQLDQDMDDWLGWDGWVNPVNRA